jgi:hypothetical protein
MLAVTILNAALQSSVVRLKVSAIPVWIVGSVPWASSRSPDVMDVMDLKLEARMTAMKLVVKPGRKNHQL